MYVYGYLTVTRNKTCTCFMCGDLHPQILMVELMTTDGHTWCEDLDIMTDAVTASILSDNLD